MFSIQRQTSEHVGKNGSINAKVSYPSRTIVHPKLETTEPGDSDEQEADVVANDVMSGRICRQISHGNSGGGMTVSSQMEGRLNSLQGGGQVMPDSLRNMMERGFNRDFSQVRLHTDGEAASLSSSIHAKAFTHGNDIYFNQGQFSPNTSEGQRLMAHELTHVVQGGSKISRISYPKINNRNYEELHDKIIEICDKVLPIINGIVDGSISQDDMGKYEKIFKKYVYDNSDASPLFKKPELFLQFNQKIQILLTQLKKNLNQLELGIQKGSMPEIPEAMCSTNPDIHKKHKITCYSDVWWEKDDEGEYIYNDEDHAFAIIHEFSHMWFKTDDFCYWYPESNHRKDVSNLMAREDYCGKDSNKRHDKSNTASAIEYYIHNIYKLK